MVVILLTSSPAKYTVKTIIKLNKVYTKMAIRIDGHIWSSHADQLTAVCNTMD